MEAKDNSIARNADNGADKTETTVKAKNSAARKGTPPLFSKETLLRSERFACARDALDALLADGGSYSAREAENILRDFYKKAVK